MKPVLDDTETILNASVLTAADVVHKRVRCPVCGIFVFKRWPEGWDGHASSNVSCKGLSSRGAALRKEEFKDATRHLFRGNRGLTRSRVRGKDK